MRPRVVSGDEVCRQLYLTSRESWGSRYADVPAVKAKLGCSRATLFRRIHDAGGMRAAIARGEQLELRPSTRSRSSRSLKTGSETAARAQVSKRGSETGGARRESQNLGRKASAEKARTEAQKRKVLS